MSIRIFYDIAGSESNDREERYFVPRIKLTNIDGLNYLLSKDGTAMLHSDDCIKEKVLRVPERIVYDGRTYTVACYGDVFADPQFGSNTNEPQGLEEIFFPATIKEVYAYTKNPTSLRAIHFAGDIEMIGEYASVGCNQLSEVDFQGRVDKIEYAAFADTNIKDIKRPEVAKVAPGSFQEHSL